jgi:hypothetical protein
MTQTSLERGTAGQPGPPSHGNPAQPGQPKAGKHVP